MTGGNVMPLLLVACLVFSGGVAQRIECSAATSLEQCLSQGGLLNQCCIWCGQYGCSLAGWLNPLNPPASDTCPNPVTLHDLGCPSDTVNVAACSCFGPLGPPHVNSAPTPSPTSAPVCADAQTRSECTSTGTGGNPGCCTWCGQSDSQGQCSVSAWYSDASSDTCPPRDGTATFADFECPSGSTSAACRCVGVTGQPHKVVIPTAPPLSCAEATSASQCTQATTQYGCCTWCGTASSGSCAVAAWYRNETSDQCPPSDGTAVIADFECPSGSTSAACRCSAGVSGPPHKATTVLCHQVTTRDECLSASTGTSPGCCTWCGTGDSTGSCRESAWFQGTESDTCPAAGQASIEDFECPSGATSAGCRCVGVSGPAHSVEVPVVQCSDVSTQAECFSATTGTSPGCCTWCGTDSVNGACVTSAWFVDANSDTCPSSESSTITDFECPSGTTIAGCRCAGVAGPPHVVEIPPCSSANTSSTCLSGNFGERPGCCTWCGTSAEVGACSTAAWATFGASSDKCPSAGSPFEDYECSSGSTTAGCLCVDILGPPHDVTGMVIPSAFENSHQAFPGYTFYWTFVEPATLHVGVISDGQGWVSWGVGNTEEGADIVWAVADVNGTVHVSDRYLNADLQSVVDDSYDLSIALGRRNLVQTHFKFTRLLTANTTGGQDAEVAKGFVNVFAAMSNTDDNASYSTGSTRRTSMVQLAPCISTTTACSPCYGYGDSPRRVDITTLAHLLSSWGSCGSRTRCTIADNDCNSSVDIVDLTNLLTKWGSLGQCQC